MSVLETLQVKTFKQMPLVHGVVVKSLRVGGFITLVTGTDALKHDGKVGTYYSKFRHVGTLFFQTAHSISV